MNDYVFVTFEPDVLEPKCWIPLAWSIAEGWVSIFDYDVSVFSQDEVIINTLMGTAPQKIPFPVIAVKASKIALMLFEAKAHLN